MKNVFVPSHLSGSSSLYALTALLFLGVLWAYSTPIDISVSSRGIVRPEGDAIQIVSEVSGRIASVPATEGAIVHSGDTLVQLDTHDIFVKRASLESRIHFMEVRQQHSELARLYDELRQANLDLSRLTITSPAQGQITMLAPLYAGEHLAAGAAIASIVPSTSSLVIESWLPASERTAIHPGQTARIKSGSRGEVLDASILSISPDAHFNESRAAAFRVLLIPADDSPDLRLGMTFDVHFITREQRLLFLLFDKLGSEFE